VIERHFRGTIHYGRVAVKLGKPTTFATIPQGPIAEPVFALRGNPASAFVMFNVLVVPALRWLGSWLEARCELACVPVTVCALSFAESLSLDRAAHDVLAIAFERDSAGPAD
jgi:gephyrin